jgi:hypothetical protein
LTWATATPPHVTPASSKAKTAMPVLLHWSPALPHTRIAAIPCDRYSCDELIDPPVDE